MLKGIGNKGLEGFGGDKQVSSCGWTSWSRGCEWVDAAEALWVWNGKRCRHPAGPAALSLPASLGHRAVRTSSCVISVLWSFQINGGAIPKSFICKLIVVWLLPQSFITPLEFFPFLWRKWLGENWILLFFYTHLEGLGVVLCTLQSSRE